MRLSGPILAVALFAAFAAPAAASGGGSSAPAQQQAPATRQERLTSAESYVPMPTFSAGVLQGRANYGTIVIDIGLDVEDVDLRRRLLFNAPRVRDALRTALATYCNTYYREHTAPNPETLTRLLQQAVDRTLGAQGARVLLANIIYQGRQAN